MPKQKRKSRIPNFENRDFMIGHELKLFKSQRNEGSLSFFRINYCLNCVMEILKSKNFCSKKCRDKYEEKNKSNMC